MNFQNFQTGMDELFMSVDSLSIETTVEVRDTCLCLHAQRAARLLARRFDEALRPVRMTNGQFSLMMSLNRPGMAGCTGEVGPAGTGAAGMREIAELLGMDRTTLTASVKTLQRRGWVEVLVSGTDRRGRCMRLTVEGRQALAAGLPIWRREHGALQAELVEAGTDAAGLRLGLGALG